MVALNSISVDDVRLFSPWVDAPYGRLLLVKGKEADEPSRIGLKAVVRPQKDDVQTFVNCEDWTWGYLRSDVAALDVSSLFEIRVKKPIPREPRTERGNLLSRPDGSSFIYVAGLVGGDHLGTGFFCVEGSKYGTEYVLGRIYNQVELGSLYYLGLAFFEALPKRNAS